MGKKLEIKQGDRYGRLRIVKEIEQKNKHRYIECECDCGNKTITTLNHLRRGLVKSCKCNVIIHGQSKSKTYVSWRMMKQRCLNPNNRDYKDYGGRGITVCDRWMKFENFFADMGERPEGTTLDRIDVNGNYEPNNCRWATSDIQASNKRK